MYIDGSWGLDGALGRFAVTNPANGEVIAEAAEAIASGERRLLEFGVADETAWRVGLSCGGRIRVYVERID